MPLICKTDDFLPTARAVRKLNPHAAEAYTSDIALAGYLENMAWIELRDRSTYIGIFGAVITSFQSPVDPIGTYRVKCSIDPSVLDI